VHRLHVAPSVSWLLGPVVALACGGGGADSASSSFGNTEITTVGATTGGTTGPDTPTGTGSSGPGGEADAQSGSEDTTAGTGTTLAETGSGSTDPSSSSSMSTATGPGDDSTGPGEPTPCQVEMKQVFPIPPDVLLVLDKSGSMSMESWDHDEDPQTPAVTRWKSLHGVVKDVVTKFDDTVNFGVKLYPKIDAGSFVDQGACVVNPGVEVEIAPMNAVNVLAGIPDADFEVLGGTPMETGVKEAYSYLTSLDPGNQRFALLIADGEISKTCQGEVFQEAVAAVEQALVDHGIPTYVVGIDVDGTTSEQLTDLALAGGKTDPNGPPLFYQTTSQIQLQAAIQQIVDDTLSCVVDVDPAPSEPELFEAWVGGEKADPVADCAKDDGWVWTQEFTQLELCGAACQKLKQSGKVEVRYFCEAN
jgi:hypothetical protein